MFCFRSLDEFFERWLLKQQVWSATFTAKPSLLGDNIE
jgi:hypothetical protein